MWVMVAATALTVTLPVLASFIIADFGLTRTEFGVLGAVGGVLAALASPYAGTITDRIGGRAAALVVLAGAAAASLMMAGAPVYGLMFVGAVVGAITGAAGNPSTNKLIASLLEPGRRGVATGIKQTGPQVGSLFAGLLAPLGATELGWRPTLVIMAAAIALPIPLVSRMTRRQPAAASTAAHSGSGSAAGIRWVAVYGFLLGLGNSATFLFPLFVEEELGRSTRVAGLAAALLGGAAVLGRLQWARLVERHPSPAPALVFLAGGSVVAMALMLASISFGIGWMWVGTIVLAFSASSWTAVGAMAVISIAGAAGAGRASGTVWFGFLAGLGVGPPIYGLAVDRTDSYALMWWLALVVFALAAGVATAWVRTGASEAASRPPPSPPGIGGGSGAHRP